MEFRERKIDNDHMTNGVTLTVDNFYLTLGSWREFGCRDDANAWRKSTKEADNTQNFLLQFRK